ncbi:MAG: beta strand repeat-containing protein [Caulobacteraceae bacterium]
MAAGAATITNSGTITTQNGGGVEFGTGGGVVTNNRYATISSQGGQGVLALGGAGTIVNGGDIDGYAGIGIDFTLSNSSQIHLVTNNAGGTVHGDGGGVRFANSGTVNNSGAITAYSAAGIYAAGTCTVTNGAGALIEGHGGIRLRNGSVANLGFIQGGSGAGIYAAGKCAVTNGSATQTTATIQGSYGVQLNAGSLANFGTIEGMTFGYGVTVEAANVTNGSATDSKALIQGYAGLRVGAYGLNTTVTNFGTIAASGARAAVTFRDASDVLAVEAGCVFKGAVLGGGGTLVLDTGTGTITGELAGGTVSVSGSMAATAFSNFGTVRIGPTATFATSGAVSLAAGQSLVAAGSLTLGGKAAAIANAGAIETLGGTVTVAGKVTGKGEAIVNGGLIDFTSTFSQSVTFAGTTGTLELAKSQGYGGTIVGFSTAGGTFLDLADIAFTGAGEATYAGNKKGGVLTVTDGTHTATIALTGNYLGSTFVAASDGHGGVLIHDPKAPTLAPTHAFIAALASLGAGAAGLEAAAVERLHAPPMLLAPGARVA